MALIQKPTTGKPIQNPLLALQEDHHARKPTTADEITFVCVGPCDHKTTPTTGPYKSHRRQGLLPPLQPLLAATQTNSLLLKKSCCLQPTLQLARNLLLLLDKVETSATLELMISHYFSSELIISHYFSTYSFNTSN